MKFMIGERQDESIAAPLDARICRVEGGYARPDLPR
jgi:hypothetical protein